MTELQVVLLLLAVAAACAAVSYNRFVRQRHHVEESWRQVDVELRRRHDLVPALVQTVQAYATHEQRALEQVLAARQQVLAARAAASDGGGPSPPGRAGAEADLTGSLRGLLAVAEGYPQLRAAEPYTRLQQQLAETEDRLAAARRFYNGNVRALNTRVEAFPSVLVARAAGVERADYFELEPLERASLELPPDVSADDPLPPAGDRLPPTRPQPGAP